MVSNIVMKDDKDILEHMRKIHLLNRHVVDSLEGKISHRFENGTDFIKIGGLSFGLAAYDSEEIESWVHEFTEACLTYLLVDMLVEEGVTMHTMLIALRPLTIMGSDGGYYNPTMKHLLVALHTTSGVPVTGLSIKIIDGDEFAKLFLGVKKTKLSRCGMYNLFDKQPMPTYRCAKKFYTDYSKSLDKYIKECDKDESRYNLGE